MAWRDDCVSGWDRSPWRERAWLFGFAFEFAPVALNRPVEVVRLAYLPELCPPRTRVILDGVPVRVSLE
jgi:hypothetical protein